MKKKKITVRLNFTWDDCDDIKGAMIYVPECVTEDDVTEEIVNAHNFLCNEDETDIYGIEGRTPGTLLNYVCEKNSWEWFDIEFDVDLNLM